MLSPNSNDDLCHLCINLSFMVHPTPSLWPIYLQFGPLKNLVQNLSNAIKISIRLITKFRSNTFFAPCAICACIGGHISPLLGFCNILTLESNLVYSRIAMVRTLHRSPYTHFSQSYISSNPYCTFKEAFLTYSTYTGSTNEQREKKS